MCEGLEQLLRNIPLQDLSPPLNLEVVDIDSHGISQAKRARFDLKVPVMVISFKEKNSEIELPRVSPRLEEKELFRWIQTMLSRFI